MLSSIWEGDSHHCPPDGCCQEYPRPLDIWRRGTVVTVPLLADHFYLEPHQCTKLAHRLGIVAISPHQVIAIFGLPADE